MGTPEREELTRDEAVMMDEQVGTLLRAWRQERGLSLNALARQARLGKATLSRWETGTCQPSITELEAALAALEATPAQRAAALARIRAPRAIQALRRSADARPPVSGDLLRAMRLRSGRTLEETARAVGVSHSTLLRWERGELQPSNTHLHALCYTLGAHPLEAAALTVGGSGPWLAHESTASDEPTGASRQAERLRLLSQRLDQVAYQQRGCVEADGLRDLRFLALEAELWLMAHRGNDTTSVASNARHQLAHTYARHAEYLADHGRWGEAGQSAQRSLDTVKPLFGEPSQRRRLQFTAWPVAALVKVRATVQMQGSRPVRQRAAAGRGALTLVRWLEREPGRPGYRAWMTSEIADYFARYGDVERALATARTACRLVEDAPQVMPVEVALRRRDYARLLTQAGRAEEALALLQSTADWRGQPVHQASEDLLWAEALRAAGDTTGAQQRLTTARPLITGSHLGSLRARAEALAATL